MPPTKIDHSLIIPVYNEEGSLQTLFAEIVQVMTPLNRPYEVVFVNDGSNDDSAAIMDNFAREFPEVVRVIHLNERHGQTFALRTGLEASRGNAVITLDADLQNDPADILFLIKKMEEDDLDCVCGWRKARQDTALKAGLSKLGNILQRLFTGIKIHDVSCTLRIYRRPCIGRITLNWEGQHRFIPLSLSLQGFKVGEIVSHHRLRTFGTTKYSHKRIFRVVVDFFRVVAARGRA